jgi:hypothetical protein
MPFGSKPDANLIKNNMVKETLGVDQEVKTGEKINTAELAQKALEDERNLAKLNEAEQKQTPAKLDSIRASMPKTENSQEAAARKAHRVEFIQKALQMVIVNLQSQIDQKGPAGWFTPKKEIGEAVIALQKFQGEKNDEMVWKYQFEGLRPARFASDEVKKQILSMVKEEFDLEDQKIFDGTEQVKDQVGHQLTDVSS